MPMRKKEPSEPFQVAAAHLSIAWADLMVDIARSLPRWLRSTLLVVVVVVFVVEVGRAVEGGPVTEGGIIVVLSEGIVVVLGMVVGTDDVLLEKTEVVVVSDGASVVDDARVLVEQ